MGLIIRIVCAYVGYKLLWLPGIIIGLIVGHFIARALQQRQQRFDPSLRQQIESTLFGTAFPLMGYLAKADGLISTEEVNATEQLMAKMQLSPAQRQEAINLFKGGAKPGFKPEPLVRHFMHVCGSYADIRQILLVYLMTVAMADGNIDAAEKSALQAIAEQLGFSQFIFEQLLKMANAQQHFKGGHYQGGQRQQQASSADVVIEAYQALGVEPSCTDAELKKAYRKLMSQYHPDKLAGQGVPEEMIKVATERSQEIQAAYNIVKKARQ